MNLKYDWIRRFVLKYKNIGLLVKFIEFLRIITSYVKENTNFSLMCYGKQCKYELN
jgi:hypothetical protein